MISIKNRYRNSFFDHFMKDHSSVSFRGGAFRGLDMEGYRESILDDIQRLFDTRSHLTVTEYENGELTVLDFGIPDLLHLSPANQNDKRIAEKILCKALQTFEPRLTESRVKIVSFEHTLQRYQIQIEGWLTHQKSAQLRLVFVASWDHLINQWLIH